MSFKAMLWAWEQELNPSAKLVLMSLANYTNKEHQCWPGIKLISEEAGVEPRTVRKWIAHLESAGLITRQPQTREDGSRKSNLYQLNLGAKRAGGTDLGSGGTDLGSGGTDLGSPHEPVIEPVIEPLTNIHTGVHRAVSGEPIKEPSPEYYSDLFALPGFKAVLPQVEEWLISNSVRKDVAQRVAAALRGKWDSKKYKDPWATFRNWCLREKGATNGGPPQSAPSDMATFAQDLDDRRARRGKYAELR
jgi:DNA-binding transcriptional ArsR family regulator